MEALIHDLKSKLAIDLDESPATLRKMGSAAAVGGANYLVVGSSNARRLAAALNAKGVPAGSVICNGWRATKQSVIDMACLDQDGTGSQHIYCHHISGPR